VRRTARPDAVSLTAGLALVVLGAVLLLDRMGTVDLTFSSMAPIAFAAIGAILLASGLSRGRRER
jgi:LiaI-LiaF-like transmembrane region